MGMARTDAFDATSHPDEAVEAIKALQAVLSTGHEEHRTRWGRQQKQISVDELISVPETLVEAGWAWLYNYAGACRAP